MKYYPCVLVFHHRPLIRRRGGASRRGARPSYCYIYRPLHLFIALGGAIYRGISARITMGRHIHRMALLGRTEYIGLDGR